MSSTQAAMVCSRATAATMSCSLPTTSRTRLTHRRGVKACARPTAAALRKSAPATLQKAAGQRAVVLQPKRLTSDGAADDIPSSEIDSFDSSFSSGAALGGLGALAAAVLACPSAHAAAIEQLSTTFTIPGVVGDSPVTEGIVSGFLLILFSELGDKTFFIAMLLAAAQSKTEVFAGTFGALAVMTVISVGLGQVMHQIDELVPAGLTDLPLDDVVAAVLLIVFGIQTLQAANDADQTAAEEKEEAQETVDSFSGGQSMQFILSTFALVFAAEWGDKSFIATIALAAASSPLGVTLGAVGGHGFATVIAVTVGSVMSNYVSERTVQYVGGSLFLVFAAATIYDIIGQTV